MVSPVIILNSEKAHGHLKAMNLCGELVDAGITFLYAKIGVQHTITVAETDVAAALKASYKPDTGHPYWQEVEARR